MNHTKSHEIYNRGIKVIPGGVNSPVRAFGSVNNTPIFVKEGNGSKLVDIDNNEYIDYVCSWGPLIFGHNSDIATEGIGEAIKKGTTYGMPTSIEVELAELIVDTFNFVDMVRMVSSGTEAAMSALRLARGYTNKDKIIKFEGCYHGHSDGLLVKSGSGTLVSGVPTSQGVPKGIIDETLVAEFNNIESVKALIEENPEDVAAIIIEPIPGNMGLVKAKEGFLQALRQLCDENDIVLIFDEVISGFRIGFTGAAGYYNIEPDLICFGKIIGGGMPVGAYAGKKEIMSCVAPLGGVYQAGTLSGNPIAMTMGLNVLKYLKKNKDVYTHLENIAVAIEKGFSENLEKLQIENVTINREGGMICQFFAKGPIDNYEKVMQSNTEQYTTYFNAMLEQGILLPPAQFECLFLSTAHTKADIEKTVKCHYNAMKKVKEIWTEI